MFISTRTPSVAGHIWSDNSKAWEALSAWAAMMRTPASTLHRNLNLRPSAPIRFPLALSRRWTWGVRNGTPEYLACFPSGQSLKLLNNQHVDAADLSSGLQLLKHTGSRAAVRNPAFFSSIQQIGCITLILGRSALHSSVGNPASAPERQKDHNDFAGS